MQCGSDFDEKRRGWTVSAYRMMYGGTQRIFSSSTIVSEMMSVWSSESSEMPKRQNVCVYCSASCSLIRTNSPCTSSVQSGTPTSSPSVGYGRTVTPEHQDRSDWDEFRACSCYLGKQVLIQIRVPCQSRVCGRVTRVKNNPDCIS